MPLSLEEVHQATALLRRLLDDRSQLDEVPLAGERIELAHVAEDRSLFAQGAIKAALWGRGRKPGLYSMADVLGLDTL